MASWDDDDDHDDDDDDDNDDDDDDYEADGTLGGHGVSTLGLGLGLGRSISSSTSRPGLHVRHEPFTHDQLPEFKGLPPRPVSRRKQFTRTVSCHPLCGCWLGRSISSSRSRPGLHVRHAPFTHDQLASGRGQRPRPVSRLKQCTRTVSCLQSFGCFRFLRHGDVAEPDEAHTRHGTENAQQLGDLDRL